MKKLTADDYGVFEEFDAERECGVLIIKHDGYEVARYYDNMEPEDAIFGRDLGWVAMELEKAYKLGYIDSMEMES